MYRIFFMHTPHFPPPFNNPPPPPARPPAPAPRLTQGGKLDLALETLRRMRSDPSRYPAPNTVCYNAALMALMRRGRWREARELLAEVAATSTEASRAAGRSGEEGGREGGGVSMRGLDFLSYNSVIRACAAAGEAKEVNEVKSEEVVVCTVGDIR